MKIALVIIIGFVVLIWCGVAFIQIKGMIKMGKSYDKALEKMNDAEAKMDKARKEFEEDKKRSDKEFEMIHEIKYKNNGDEV